jgi:hypothetical protein
MEYETVEFSFQNLLSKKNGSFSKMSLSVRRNYLNAKVFVVDREKNPGILSLICNLSEVSLKEKTADFKTSVT